MKCFYKAFCAAMATVLLVTGAAIAQVLEQIPGDALVVVKITGLRQTSDKIARFTEDLGLVALNPDLADPLGAVQQQIGAVKGINEQGEAAFVLRDPQSVGAEKPDDAFLLLIPVADYAAFLGNFQGAQTQDGVTQVLIGEQQDDGYVAQWGAFAAVAPRRELVQQRPQQRLPVQGNHARKVWQERDIVVFANIPALRDRLAPVIQQNSQEFLEGMVEGMTRQAEDAQKFEPVVRVFGQQLLNVADAFLRDAQAATLTVQFHEDGLSTDLMADFAPTSYLGKIVAGLPSGNQSLLAGIPSGKYLAFGGAAMQGRTINQLIDDLVGPVVAEVLKLGDEYKPIADYLNAAKQYVSATQSQSFGMVAPEGALGAAPIVQVVQVQRGNPAQMLAATRAMAETQQQVMQAFGLPGGLMQLEYTEKAREVGGLQFDLFTQTVQVEDNDPMAAQQQQMMAMMYGPEGMQMYLAAIDDKLLAVSGLSEEKIVQAIEAARAGASPLSDLPGVKLVDARLPRNRMMVVYVPLDQIVATAASYAAQFGMPVQLNLPADLPPIGTAIAAHDSAMSVETFVPTTLLQNIISAGMQAFMGMQGGGNGGL
jgi:hypothetical protein